MSIGDAFKVNSGLASRLETLSKQLGARNGHTILRLNPGHTPRMAGVDTDDEAIKVSLTRRPEPLKAGQANEGAAASDARQAKKDELARANEAAFKIRDAAMAEETAAFTKARIAQAVGASVLAQGGVSPQGALSLLKA